VKRWYYFALAAAVVAGAAYVYLHWGSSGVGGLAHLWDRGDAPSADQPDDPNRPAPMSWQTVERPNDGFKVDLPADAKDVQVPAYNEAGGAEAVKMVFANPNSDTTFAMTWEDNPPVARVNHTPDRILNTARDGMLARTQTVITSESHGLQRGYPSLEVGARNAGGGVLNARFIYTGNRLYMLIALFPSATARREKDVKQFFDSFVPSRLPSVPETTPSASTLN
jgi:hypothetical protein